jgi:hypothetical protein
MSILAGALVNILGGILECIFTSGFAAFTDKIPQWK